MQSRSVNETKFTHYVRLKEMVQSHVQQKIKQSHCNAGNRLQNETLSGASAKGKAKGKGKTNIQKVVGD